MRTAETVLGIIRERGRRGLPLEDLYRQLYNPALYLLAYGKIYRNRGALTAGTSAETVDGMALKTIQALIEALRCERYRWTPVRRVYIEKKRSSKKRPLGIPTWSDKLLQEVIRLILEAYYEPQFRPSSHGFRPGRGCHTALRKIHQTWKGTAWFIEGDISRCFDSLDHQVLLATLREKLHDNRFVRLIENLLKAGYLEEWKYHATRSGTPQGGIVSPILANIYLDRLDQFVDEVLLPAYNRGKARTKHPEYDELMHEMSSLAHQGKPEEALARRKQAQRLPSKDPHDPDYRRLRYVRYADDFLLGYAGPRQEAEAIKSRLREYLRDHLKLELSAEKTLITHARTSAARFLGYEIVVIREDQKRNSADCRSINGQIGLKVPVAVGRAKCQPYMKRGKPVHRQERIDLSIYTTLVVFQQEFRGIVEYYRLAYNLSTQLRRLKWVMEQSLTKTLAKKLKASVKQVYRRFGTTIATERGPTNGLEVKVERGAGQRPLIARWGGISLAREANAVLNDRPKPIWNCRSELVQRLLADTCELCGSPEDVEVHHIRQLRDLQRNGRAERPKWVEWMASRRRKTLVVCHACHTEIHQGGRTRQAHGS